MKSEAETSLYLPTVDGLARIIITMAPLNSSGDIYHIMAYILLALANNCKVPDIELTYDIASKTPDGLPTHSTLTTENQANRSLHFLQAMGLSQYVKAVKVPYISGRENVRHAQLLKELQRRSNHEKRQILYIDQMATTTFIAAHVKNEGLTKTTDIIARGVANRDNEFFPLEMQTKIDAYVTKAISLLTQANPSKKPLVVFHLRYSSHANKYLNLPDSFVTELVLVLSKCGYQLCFIHADDRKKIPSYSKTFPSFTPFHEEGYAKAERDYSKQLHLQLLLGLKNNTTVQAVIGNTSGTLDLSAFIGLMTYGIHRFITSTISYQECRLYFQLCFMTVVALNRKVGAYELGTPLEDWLNSDRQPKFEINGRTTPRTPKKLLASSANSGYEKMFSGLFFSPQRSPKHIELPESKTSLRA